MPAPAKATTIVLVETPVPRSVGEMLRCLTCGDITDGSDLAFSEVLFDDPQYEAHGHWMYRSDTWWHLCDHYAVDPQPTKIIDLWK